MAIMAAAGGMSQSSNPASNQIARETVASETMRISAQPAERNRAPAQNHLASMMMTGFGTGSRGHQRRSGPGWTQAQVQRRARKAKNVSRHRASLRG